MQPDSEASRAAGLDLTLLTDLTGRKGRRGRLISEDAGHWVSTYGPVFSCGDCYPVCVSEAVPFSIFMRL